MIRAEVFPPFERALSAIRKAGAIAVIGTVVAGGIYIAAEHGPIGPIGGGGGGGVAGLNNVYAGAAGTCTRSSTPVVYDATTSCGTFQAAYLASHSGDTVGVRTGTYEVQKITRDVSKGTAGPDVTFVPDGGVVTITGGAGGNTALAIGDPCKCSAGPPPNHLVFDGGTLKEFHTGVPGVMGGGGLFGQVKVYPDYESNPASDILPDHITLRNMIVCNGCPDHGGGTIELGSASNVVIDKVQVGPICCGTNVDGSPSTSPTHVLVGQRGNERGGVVNMTTNLTVTDSRFLGETYCGAVGGGNANCFHADWPAALGPPPQPNCSDPNACHADCFHFTGIDGLTFKRNILYSCRAQALFFENQNRGYSKDVTIVDNYLGSLSACSFCIGGSAGQVNTTRGTMVFAFNTGNAGMGFSGPATFDTAGGTITMVGNLGGIGNHGDDTNNDGCSFLPTNWTVTYQYNVFTNMNNGGGGNVSVCNAHGIGNIATDTYPVLPVLHQGDWGSTPSDNNTDYGLNSGSVAQDFVPSAICATYSALDTTGTVRPQGSACDAGGDER